MLAHDRNNYGSLQKTVTKTQKGVLEVELKKDQGKTCKAN